MAKIIFTSRYIKNAKRVNAGKLVKYMGMRDGVEKLPMGNDYSKATKKQKDLVFSLIEAIPEAYGYPEFDEFCKSETKVSASDFIDAFIERNAERIDGIKKLVSYIDERPGVEKLGRHGLFSQSDDKIDIDAVAEKISNHEGILWTHVISLRREDAERLCYNTASAWKSLVRRSALQIAEAHKIELPQLRWYAAFHNTTHHPHIHLMVYSNDPKQGYLTNKGIETMRGVFANDIFRNEQYHMFELQTKLRDEVKEEAKERLYELLERCKIDDYCDDEKVRMFQKLMSQLENQSGKLMYGYLPKTTKETVNEIVNALSKDERITELYSEWNKANREKLLIYYDKPKPDIPLAENKEFRSIKNAVIKAAVSLMREPQQYSSPQMNVSKAVNEILGILGSLLAASYQQHRERLGKQIDSKLKSKIEEKKAAHGIRTDYSVPDYSDDEEEQRFIW